ncbi:hypothetical protein M422DRAFT_247123 [Sphaerobolus stellatus SS14]|nr:hypothetical protein M422DRAFT_247123 [Sphaerobolus stellatus SS14]
MESLQRTLATLRPGPGFESARVKAEAKFLPGGYAKVGRQGERLVGDMDDGDDSSGGSPADTFNSRRSSKDYRVGDRVRGLDQGSIDEGNEIGDEYKMPVRPGEGWVSLS